jgi:signal recognition particle receptor subunit beta
VKVTVWDVVEKALLPVDANAFRERPDASIVDTMKRADGLVVVIDHSFEDTIALAAEIVQTALLDIPIIVFSNFTDLEGASPLIPEKL